MDVNEILNKWLKIDERLLNDYLTIEKIIIYGNLAKDANDIDLIFVSDDFAQMYSRKRKDTVMKAIVSLKKLDLLCLTNDEFNRMKGTCNLFNKNVFEKGVLIYDRII